MHFFSSRLTQPVPLSAIGTQPTSQFAVSCTGCQQSKLAIAHLEMRRLVPSRAPTAHPVGDPVDHLTGADARVAEQAVGHLTVAKDRVAAFTSFKDHRAVQE